MEKIASGLTQFNLGLPFRHCVIDDFFNESIASSLENDFPEYGDSRWLYYKNAIEDKKVLNDWNCFPELTYKVFRQLISDEFISMLSAAVGTHLYPDPGLHGGGWHIHGAGGNLNPHLDYSIHPKIGLQRKLNIIVYLSSELKEIHGGHLGLWSHNKEGNLPDTLIKEVGPKFNRAVLFDTTQNSWHGMSRPLQQPEDVYRKSMAVYYLAEPPKSVDPRQRALFAPRTEQIGDNAVEDLIKLRADPKNFSKAYRSEG